MELNTITVSYMLIISGLTGVILALALAYHRVVTQLKNENKPHKHLEDKSYKQAEEILDRARQEALATLQEATQKSTRLITQGGKFADEQKSEIAKQMKMSSEEELQSYGETLKQTQAQMLQALGQVTDELQRSSESELTHFRQELVKSTQETQALFMKQMQSELAEADSSVAQYKQALLEKANQRMFAVVQQVVQEVLHKALTQTEHEALVLEALEEAKKHHVL